MASLRSFFEQWLCPPTVGSQPHRASISTAAGYLRECQYPPVDRGLPAVAFAEVIAPHAQWLKRLRDAYGADQTAFDRDVGGAIERYAQYVHLLPATPDGSFRGVGGLFRMGLEIGFHALQATDGAIFAGRQTISERSTLEPRWRLATFLAGMCSGLHRSLQQLIVTTDEGRRWPAFLLPLAFWLQEQKVARYYLCWLPASREAPALGLLAMTHIVTPTIMQYLAEGNSIIVPQLLASISGTAPQGEGNTLDHLVRRCSALVIDRERDCNVDHYGRAQLGSRLERYLVDAMRHLVAHGKWVANDDKSPLWYAADGMFLLWPRAAADMIEVLHEERLPGVPKAPATIAEILAAAGVVEPRADGSTLWDIFVPDAATSSPALKVRSPQLLSAAETAAAPLRVLKRAVANVTAPSNRPCAQLALSFAESGGAAAGNGRPLPLLRERADDGTAAAPAAAPQASLALITPARFNPAVRDCLQQILATVDSPLPPAGFMVDLGVFVPLHEFERRGVDTALAVRALSDAHMLASDPTNADSKTLSRHVHDRPTVGIVLAPHGVAGIDERGFGERAKRLPVAPG